MMNPSNAYCSFCRKSHQDVGPLVEGSDNVYICAECVELCQSIIIQEKRRRQRSAESPSPLPAPEVIEAQLHFFIGVPRTSSKPIADAVHSHWEDRRVAHHSEGEKSVLLLIGPSRSSALLLARVLSHILDVPFAAGRARDLASTCSPDEPRDSVFLRLLHASDYDVEAAQRGVVFLNGIDLPDAQEMLVSVLEEKSLAAVSHALQINIGFILFICHGDFAGLDEHMVRHGKHPEQPITSEDLSAVGVSPEFLRRVGTIVRVSSLDDETMVRLIVSADLKRWPKDSNI